MKLSLAYSPCPNDTFMFHDLAIGCLRLPGYEIEPYLHDVETLNSFALQERFDITKLSFYAYLKVREHYDILATGAALGFGCGPILIGKKAVKRSELANCRIAIPGKLTTAHLLFLLWAPKVTHKLFVTYDQIFEYIVSGKADCGILIHESRFTYEQAGFQKILDLGSWWEEKTSLPVPLGCIAIHKRLPTELVKSFETLLKQSIKNSLANPETALGYIRQHAQEMDENVLLRHIETFVNQYSLDLGKEGMAAVTKLEEMALGAGVIA